MYQLELVFQLLVHHVPPVQRVLKHCGVHKHIILYIHARDPKQS